MILISLILFFLFSKEEIKPVGSIVIWIENGDTYYKTQVDGRYLIDECHMMTYIALQAQDHCGTEGMNYWADIILKPIENDSIRRF